MLKVLSLRSWWLQQLSRLGEINAGSPSVEDLLSLCRTSPCPFSSGDGSAAALPRSVVEPFRNARAEKERALESIARIPMEIHRAKNYWDRFVALLQHGIRLREQRVRALLGEARPWLPKLLACSGTQEGLQLGLDIAASLAARGTEVTELLGQVRVLRRSLRLGSAQAAIGEATQRRVEAGLSSDQDEDGPGHGAETPETDVDEELALSDTEAAAEYNAADSES